MTRPISTTGRRPTWLTEVPLAHRGLHDAALGVPENSLPAFEAAARAAVGVELDTRLTVDGVAVVAHDANLRASTGRNLRLAALPAEVVSELTLDGTEHRIPTLDQALAVLSDVPVMIEIKNEGLRVGPHEAVVAAAVARHAGPVTVTSFNPRTVAWFWRHAPGVLRGQTGGAGHVLPGPARRLVRGLLTVRHGRPDYLSWAVDRLDDDLVRAAREQGLPLYAWTVRTPEEVRHAWDHDAVPIFEGLPPEAAWRPGSAAGPDGAP